jgi:hypothetical protein
MPNAFTKHAAANAPVSARAAPPKGDIIFDVMDGTDPVPYDAVVDFIFEEIHSELEQHGINVDDLTE